MPTTLGPHAHSIRNDWNRPCNSISGAPVVDNTSTGPESPASAIGVIPCTSITVEAHNFVDRLKLSRRRRSDRLSRSTAPFTHTTQTESRVR
jgi:hypothetical protein